MDKTVLFKNKFLRATAALFMTFVFCAGAFCDYNNYGIPDSTEIRKSIVDSWLKAPLEDLRRKPSEYLTDGVGNQYEVRFEENDDEFFIIVAPLTFINVKYVSGSESYTLKTPVYNMSSPGGWVLYRSKQDGKPTKIRWYFNADSEVYFQIRPSSVKTYVDLVVFDHYCVRSAPIGFAFEKMYSMSFQNFNTVTRKLLPWEKVTVTPGIYTAPNQMVYIIRKNLPRIEYREDAAYSSKGRLYSIISNEPYKIDGKETDLWDTEDQLYLSGLGFVKWIVDGIVEPFTLKRTEINALCVETLEFNPLGKNGTLSQKYNLTLALDWCRNISCEAMNARSSRISTWKTAGVDVDVNNFVDISGYIPDTGYSIEYLKSILYVQAVTEPGYFYLGAIKQHSKIKPEEFVFGSSAVFFPYFDDAGRFVCVVFEAGKELTLDEFLSRYDNSFVHLNRVKAAEEFYPR